MINTETIERAQRIFAMLNVLQLEIDELEEDGAFFKHKLKMKGKQFALELEKQIADFYKAMDEDANLYYNEQIKSFEAFIRAYIHNEVEVLPDK